MVLETSECKTCPHGYVFIFDCKDCRESSKYKESWEAEKRRRNRVLDSLTRKVYLRDEENG